jgi:hypothetical protein
VPTAPLAEASADGSGRYELVYYDPVGVRTQLTNGIAGGQTTVGVVKASSPAAATTGTTKQTLGTYTIPANALAANGKGYRITAWYTTAANANSKTMAIDFGSQTSVATKTTTTSADVVVLTVIILKTGSSTQSVLGTAYATAASIPVNTAGSQTDTAAIVVNLTATTGTSSGDATLQSFIVEVLN